MPRSTPSTEPSSEELALRARDGHRGSFDELVVRHRPQLVAFLARRLATPVDAEDVAQETFLRAYDHLDRFDPSARFATWLFAIGKNLAANHALAGTRRVAREQAATAEPAAVESAAVEAAAESAAALWRRAEEILRPDAYRMLWLRYARGMAIRDIATELGRSPVMIKVTLFRARRRLLQEER